MDMAAMMEQMKQMGGMPQMGGGLEDNSDDEEEESEVVPHKKGEAAKDSNIDDLEAEETNDLKK